MAHGNVGRKHSEATKAKISKAKRGRSLTAEHRAKVSKALRGREVSEETRAKIGRANRGRVISAEGRENMRQAHLGKPLSSQHRRRIGESGRGDRNGRWAGDEVGYHGVHHRLNQHRGCPSLCDHCGTTQAPRFHWALNHVAARNLREDSRIGRYSVNLDDYIRLCSKCHSIFDDNIPQAHRNG